MTSTQSKPSHGKGRECVITRRACFSSSHRYWLPEKSPEENLSLFGKCSIAPGHGHNYELIVSMGGELDSDGMVLNLSDVCLLYTSPSPRDRQKSRMPSSA